MISQLIVALATILQFVAALLAFNLLAITGKRTAWGLIPLAVIFLAVLRGLSLLVYAEDEQMSSYDLSFEVGGILITAFLVAGLVAVTPLFKKLNSTIGKLQKAEEETRRTAKILDDITANIAEGIYVFDARGHFSFMNQEAQRLTGWTFAELEGKVVHDAIHYRRHDLSRMPIEECQMIGVIKTGQTYTSSDEIFVKKDGTVFPISVISSPICENGEVVAAVTAFRDITEEKKLIAEREELIEQLQVSLETIKTLHGIIPICASCKKIRDDEGYWNQLEAYIRNHTGCEFSHGICPECARKLYPECFNEKGEMDS